MVRYLRGSFNGLLARFRSMGGAVNLRRYPNLYLRVTEVFAAAAVVGIFTVCAWAFMRQLAWYGWM